MVEREPGDGQGKLVGILTNRDVRFATDQGQPVFELMTKENLITVRENIDREEAKRLLHKYRIEKLVVVDGEYHCVGLITVKDIEKAAKHPLACKDEQGRLRVAAATSVSDEGFRRANTSSMREGPRRSGYRAWTFPAVLEAVRRIKRRATRCR